ncbi:lyase family protein [Motiliproteus sp. MSK22-1]|uniref:class II fumarate hydratase n=1 Tax=Motiliproteus sp. MSK22-1 TaxID=1897630 RepID=UPI000975C897|nr:class II fumarate hydratase [Motiliproteus sp. MSK22-1]OMH34074.1 aspartate ammonia-lyase [Motiliproteus sp. MSK22-1]
MTDSRYESDSMGELAVPANAFYGAQTQRAVNNFPISGQQMPEAFIRALLSVKIAAAKANAKLELISPEMAESISGAAEHLLNSDNLMNHFPVDVYQTGSGTSTNMNANEVLAHLASQKLGQAVGANDHVNYGQSSNDVIPSVIHISAALALERELLPALAYLSKTIRDKAHSVEKHVKTGRTHLMDAMPVRLSQSLESWAAQIEQNFVNLQSQQQSLQSLAQGGTAVGTGINAHPDFSKQFSEEISQLTGLNFSPASNLFSRIGTQDVAVALSGQLKTLAVSLMKISNDLRWMNSGPLAGLGEIELEALQPGSSIMPGKVNPVIPEAVAMVAARVIGNDGSITIAGQSGNFELNVMLPLVAQCLLESLQLLTNSCRLLADKAVAGFKVNEAKLQEALARNPILATALNPIIGYKKAAEIAKLAYQQGRPIVDVAAEQTDLSLEELRQLLDPGKLTEGGL